MKKYRGAIRKALYVLLKHYEKLEKGEKSYLEWCPLCKAVDEVYCLSCPHVVETGKYCSDRSKYPIDPMRNGWEDGDKLERAAAKRWRRKRIKEIRKWLELEDNFFYDEKTRAAIAKLYDHYNALLATGESNLTYCPLCMTIDDCDECPHVIETGHTCIHRIYEMYGIETSSYATKLRNGEVEGWQQWAEMRIKELKKWYKKTK